MNHTPGPWIWWTSNSWKRLKRDDGRTTQNVLEPYVCKDGHPDLEIKESDMLRIVACVNACEGIKDPIGLRQQRDELLEALESLVSYVLATTATQNARTSALQQAHTAIAKAHDPH